MTPRLLTATTLLALTVSCSQAPVARREPASFMRGSCEDLIAPFFSAHYRYVKSFDDFYEHTKLHRQRVVTMGDYLIKHYQSEFPDVDPKLLREFLNLHDEAKLNLELAEYEGSPLLQALYRYYGRGKHTLSEEDIIEMKKVINYLNDKDHQVGISFFKKHKMLRKSGTPNAIADQYLRIEKIVDSIDRGMNQVSIEEFDREMIQASEILSGPDAEIATEIEGQYHFMLQGILRPHSSAVAN